MADIPLPDVLQPDALDRMYSSRQSMKEYVMKNARQGDIQDIIDTIDRFGWTQQWLMNVGDQKGLILDEAIRTRQPKTVLELGIVSSLSPSLFKAKLSSSGTFLGYSSLRMAAQLPKDAHIISIEFDEHSADIARAIHQYAGVDKRITIINGDTEKVIPGLRDTYHVDSFDFIFIDHWKEVYLRDFKLLESCNLIQSGTMIVADNVIYPGAPDYLDYVRNNPNYKNTFHEAKLEYQNDTPDGVQISIRQ